MKEHRTDGRTGAGIRAVWPSSRYALAHALIALFLAGLTAFGQAQEWELRLCAEPDNLPFTNEQGEGFENRIAEIIAEELGAELSYAWLPQPTGRARDVYLRTGECDAVMGVIDGHEGFLTTLAYYRSPYVFVYREDSPFEIRSFDDPILRELSIGLIGAGGISPAGSALSKRGLIENQVTFPADYDRPDPRSAPIEAVAEGQVDVAVVWGPVAGYAAREQTAPLELVPVSPQIELPFVSMVIPMSIGVRPGDEALRDRLNVALVRRWDDIQAVLEEFGVPLEPLPQPTVGGAQNTDGEVLRIGVVLPTPTGAIPVSGAGEEIAAEAARKGAVMAGEEIGFNAELLGKHLDVLISTAPSAEAARRAGERLASADGVFALIGGFEGQAQTLSEVAEARNILFFNIGSPSAMLRNEGCLPRTFHVEASAAMYLDALAGWFVRAGFRRWFLVYPESETGEALFERARQALTGRHWGAEVVGRAAVSGSSEYTDALQAIREAEPEVVLLLLDWRDQLEFLSLYDAFGLEPALTGFPYPVTQTREFYLALGDTAVEADARHRAALWEATLDAYGARELNARFRERWGVPMDAPAWAAYAGVKMLFEAATQAGTKESAELVRYLEDPATVFDVHKGIGVSFRPWDHQLRQSLFLVQIDPAASVPRDAAMLVGELPAIYMPATDPIEHLDQLGDLQSTSLCRF